MSNPVFGMQFGTTDALHSPNYSTTQKRLQVNLNNPVGAQFAVVSVGGGTNYNVNLAVAGTFSEQLFIVTHNLGYLPQTYVTFSQIPTGSIQTPASSGYLMEQITMTSTPSVTDIINYTVTNNTLAVNHTVTVSGSGSGSYTSTAGNYSLQIKYLICNNPQIRTTVFY